MSAQYIQEVLGINQFIKPAHWNNIYIPHSSLDKKFLLLTTEEYISTHKQLVDRIMKSLHQKSYGVLEWKDLTKKDMLSDLLSRSQFQKVIAFGEGWMQEFGVQLHKPFSLSQIPFIVTYSLSQLSDESDQKLKEKKLSTFSALKDF